ncbi:MAG: NUDIX domain-containing protein [Planctomycetia bacterium]
MSAWTVLPARSCLLVRGRDAAAFVDHFTTAAVTRVEPGGGCEAFFPDARGWVIALAAILRHADELWIDAAAGIAPRLRDHLEHYHIRENVEFIDASADRAGFLVAGAAAPDWLAAHANGALPQRPLDHCRVQLAGMEAEIARLPWCGPDGFFVSVAAADGRGLEAWLAASGLPRLDPAAVDALRIEAGWPAAADSPEKALPQEFGRDATAISFTKGCYLGQETVARIDALGHVNRRLVGLATDHAVAPGAEVRCGDEPVAVATSACVSPRLATGLALALVPSKAAARGGLTVDGQTARIVPLPVPPAAAEPAVTGEVLLAARRFSVVRVPERHADGTVASREVVVHPGSVVVVPFVSPEEVCLVEVVRVAVGQTLLELPAGTLDRVEPLATAAARELAEETGYRADRIDAAGSFWMSPGILRERMHLFLATGLTPGPQALEPGEQIRTRVVPWDEAVTMCRDGRIEDAKTIAGILLVDARRRAAD